MYLPTLRRLSVLKKESWSSPLTLLGKKSLRSASSQSSGTQVSNESTLRTPFDKAESTEANNSEENKNADVDDAPIKFSTSKAHEWCSIQTFIRPPRDAPHYERHIIIFSTVVFLMYFLMLRSENDLDQHLEGPLFERVPGLEREHKRAVAHAEREKSGSEKSVVK